MRRAPFVVAWALCGVLGACSDDFESPSSVTGVRVLAVQLDQPFSRPGTDVTLTMLAHDGGAPLDAQPPLTVAWFAGCEDPEDDAPGVCHDRLRWLATLTPGQLAGDEPAALPEGAAIGHGASFVYRVPSDLIERHPVLEGESVRRGHAYVFFAACAGELVADTAERPAAGIPITCVEPASGVRLGASRFVSGYVPIRAYDQLENHNPSLGITQIGGVTPSSQPCSATTACPAGETCDEPSGRCLLTVARCDARDRADCPKIAVTPAVDEATYELDESGASPGVPASGELVWAAYFTTAGELDVPVRPIFDPAEGRSSATDYAGVYRAPPGFVGKARLWSVVHDARGGVAWTQTDVVVR